MRPRKNKKRRDPRYFLHENEDDEQEREMHFDDPTAQDAIDQFGRVRPREFPAEDVIEVDPEDVTRSTHEEEHASLPPVMKDNPNTVYRLESLLWGLFKGDVELFKSAIDYVGNMRRSATSALSRAQGIPPLLRRPGETDE